MTEEQKWQEIFRLYHGYLCEDNPEVKALALSYNEGVSSEARKIHEDAIVIDNCAWHLQTYNWHLSESGLTAVNCTVPDSMDSPGLALKRIIEYYALCNEIEEVTLVRNYADILQAKKDGKIGIIIGAQGCDFVHDSNLYESVEAFAKLGLRIMTIAYNHSSFAADGCATGTNFGLTKEGMNLIRAMEKNGIIVDLSHVGEQSCREAIDFCEKPAIFSHSNARALCDHYRNITDDMAKACAARGGVIGVSLYNVICWNGKHFPVIDDIIDHIAHFADLVGIDHVGLGSDSGANPGTYPIRECKAYGDFIREVQGTDALMYRSYEAGRGLRGYFVEGCESMANFPNITEHMLRRGFSESDIRKVLGENWMRVFKTWWS